MVKTLVNVTCSEHGKALPYTGLVIGEILTVNNNYNNNNLMISYLYKKEDGSILIHGVKMYAYAEANALYELVKGDLTPNLSYSDMEKELFEKAFKIEMASTFGIEVAEIETL